MKNVKVIAGFAGAGFLLSFTVGLFSSVPFGSVVFRAFLAAVVFAALAVAAGIVFSKCIDDGAVSGDGLDGDYAAPAAAEKTVGTAVDITLPDEDLPQESPAAQFYVGSRHPMLTEEDYRTPGTAAVEEPVVPPASVAEPLAEVPAASIAASSAENATEITSAEKAADEPAFKPMTLGGGALVAPGGSGVEDDGLDELPDIGTFALSESALETQSEFANKGDPAASVPREKTNPAKTNGTDSALMAKAISTVLANET